MENSAIDKSNYVENIWGLKVKCQGHWERKYKNRFLRISSSNVDRFKSNWNKNYQRPIYIVEYISYDTIRYDRRD